MNLNQLISVLSNHQDAPLHIMLPSGVFVPAHFHITEVGRVDKRFIDCGGTQRESSTCVLQVWVANDVDHRLKTTKLEKILLMALPLLKSGKLSVEIEFESDAVSQYPLGDVEVTPSGLLFVLGSKHTACLAPDKCGVGGCC